MSDTLCRENHRIISCPVCAKNGNGRGALQSYYQNGEDACLRCSVCNWKGDYDTVQSFIFPCKIYQVVDISLSVVENIFGMERQLERRPKFDLPPGTKVGEVLEFTIHRIPSGPLRIESSIQHFCEVDDALSYLVAKGWLFPAFYRVEVDV